MAKKSRTKRPVSVRRSRPKKKQTRPIPQDNDILNADDAAKVLGLSKQTLLRLARNGEVPGRKLAREWRFSRTTLRRWIAGDSEADVLIAAFKKKGFKAKRKK